MTLRLLEGRTRQKILPLLVDEHFSNEVEADLVDLQALAPADQRFDLFDVVLRRMAGRERGEGEFVADLQVFRHVDFEAVLDHTDQEQAMPDVREKRKLVTRLAEALLDDRERGDEMEIPLQPVVDPGTDHGHELLRDTNILIGRFARAGRDRRWTSVDRNGSRKWVLAQQLTALQQRLVGLASVGLILANVIVVRVALRRCLPTLSALLLRVDGQVTCRRGVEKGRWVVHPPALHQGVLSVTDGECFLLTVRNVRGHRHGKGRGDTGLAGELLVSVQLLAEVRQRFSLSTAVARRRMNAFRLIASEDLGERDEQRASGDEEWRFT